MSDAAQTGSEPKESPLSPWWIRSVMLVMVVGLTGLITITLLAYRNAPPICSRNRVAGRPPGLRGEAA
jgi:nitric oxide reductase subunit B